MANKSGLKPFAATMMRNPVYDPTKDEYERRECLRKALEGEACKIIANSHYKDGLVKDDDAHIANIEELQRRVTKRCKSVLAPHNKRRLLFGTAQKYLNMELKRRWRNDNRNHSEPPHCPFDWRVIKKLRRHIKGGVCFQWTRCDSRKCYKAWLKALRDSGCLGKKTIAQWEYDFWPKG